MINQKNVTIQIYSNSDPRKTMKVHYLRQETDRRKFLQMCSKELQLQALRIFDQQGKEILDINHIQMSASYYISSGEEFQNYNSIQTSSVDSRQLIQLRISLLGQGSVGKSNLTTRWVVNEFFEDYSKTLLDKYTKKVTIGQQQYQIEEAYVSLRTQWMKDKEGLVFVYAINSEESFDDVCNTLSLYEEIYAKKEIAPQIVIVGNKNDLSEERKVSYEQGQKLAESFKGLFFETSAKTGTNVNQMFTGLLTEIIQQRENVRKQEYKKVDEENKNKNQEWCQLI